MTNSAKSAPKKQSETTVPNTTKLVRNPKTGEMLTVKGWGALKDSGLEIRKDVDLLKPIFEQVFGKRATKRKAG
jgi:hypothetical protein